jgi:hypothetical protein
MLAGETTVVRAVAAPGRRRAFAWAIAGAVLLVVVASTGAFYAFQYHNKATQVTREPSPSPVINVQSAQPSPSGGAAVPHEVANANTEKEKTENTAKETKKQTPVRKKAKTDEGNAGDEGDDEGHDRSAKSKNNRAPDAPEVPDTSTAGTDIPTPNGRGPGRYPNVRTQTRPNGTKVMITPNGTRIVTYPDGSTEFSRPGKDPDVNPKSTRVRNAQSL